MKSIVLAAGVLATAAWSLSAAANPPAPKPATEHCDDKGHATHEAETHGCEHGKPAGGH